MSAPPIILHHFDQSPFSEKIRLIFGLKKIAWTSVRISSGFPDPRADIPTDLRSFLIRSANEAYL